jgi:actin related protein 2/3 complex subunit 3
MPVYHSSFNEFVGAPVCNTMVLPLRTKIKGPAPTQKDGEKDVVDEAIEFFRANVMFKKYSSEGPADLTICYLTVYIAEVLRLLVKQKTKNEGIKKLTELTMKPNFSVPGDANFVLGGFFSAPKDNKEKETFRQYYRQLREETGNRVVELAYNQDGSPNKWWLQFSKRKFMNIDSTN